MRPQTRWVAHSRNANGVACIILLLNVLSNVGFCLVKGLARFEVRLLRACDILYQCQQGPFLHKQKKEISMTVAEIFEALPNYFNPAAAAGMTKTIQWNVTGEQAGIWALKIVDGVLELIPGGVEKPDVTFTISDKDWLAFSESQLYPQNALFSGQLKITGGHGPPLQQPP